MVKITRIARLGTDPPAAPRIPCTVRIPTRYPRDLKIDVRVCA
jgi:hypothetical protein